MSDLFLQSDPARVAAQICALERFADRRDEFLVGLDCHALDQQTCRKIDTADHHIAEQILFGKLYAQHLGDMIKLGDDLRVHTQCAA